ncbi:MAG: hypothetical protein J7K22_03480 [Nanoarchaeota archaeon]|nr:hypothetical protein [Nanoarchaeota archaeon]
MELSNRAKDNLNRLKMLINGEPWAFARPISTAYWGVDYIAPLTLVVRRKPKRLELPIYLPKSFKTIQIDGFKVLDIEDLIIEELFYCDIFSAYLLYKKNENKIDKEYLFSRIMEEGGNIPSKAYLALCHFKSFEPFTRKLKPLVKETYLQQIISKEEIENKIAESYEIPPYRSFEEIVNQALENLG